MPQPFTLKEGQKPHRMAQVLETRPECAVQMALVMATWNYLEVGLTHLFEMTMSDIKATGVDSIMRKPHPRAVAALHAIDSLSARLSVIEAAAGETLRGDLATDFETLARDIRRRAGERNTVAHGIWCTVDSHPADILLTDPEAKTFTRYTVNDFKQIIGRINEVDGKLGEFTWRYWWAAAGQQWPPGIPPPPAP